MSQENRKLNHHDYLMKTISDWFNEISKKLPKALDDLPRGGDKVLPPAFMPEIRYKASEGKEIGRLMGWANEVA